MSSVLVVEDDQMFAKAVGRDLEDHGFSVVIVHSIAAALAQLTSTSIDVLLTDLQLGSQDGIDLLGTLREVSPRTRAVLMSGFATARDYQRAVELGAVRVLCKPFTPGDLIQCIRQAVECETGFRGSVHGLSLVDMLQMFNYGRRSVSITVEGQSPGRLHLHEGQIVHVEHQGLGGESALRSILAMPAGTLSTSALCATERTITRDFREVLLDALRALDEAEAAAVPGDDDDLDLGLDFQLDEATASHAEPAGGTKNPQERMLERLRDIEGYVAACLIMSANGGVLSCDGELDLRPGAAFVAELLRRSQQTIDDMGLLDEPEDVLITSAGQYHLLRQLRSHVPAFLHLVLDRKSANPAMAKRALAHAMGALEL